MINARFAVIGALALGLPRATGEMLVAPPAFAATDGGAGQNTLIRDQSRTYQMIFDPAALGGMHAGDQISALTWRMSSLDPQPVWPPAGENRSFSDYRMWLAPAANSAANMSNTFADNVGAGEVLVRSGSLLIPSQSFANAGPPGPSPWGLTFEFDVPYTYLGGSLVLTVRHPGSAQAGAAFFDAVNGAVAAQYGIRALAGLTDIHTVAPFGHANITRFTYTPEPAGAAGLLPAIPCLWWGRRRRIAAARHARSGF
jgi:hypothetical protein